MESCHKNHELKIMERMLTIVEENKVKIQDFENDIKIISKKLTNKENKKQIF